MVRQLYNEARKCTRYHLFFIFLFNSYFYYIPIYTVRTLGTEDRVKDPSKSMAPLDSVLTFVSFPGSNIKDLFVHETPVVAAQEALPTPPGIFHVTAIYITFMGLQIMP